MTQAPDHAAAKAKESAMKRGNAKTATMVDTMYFTPAQWERLQVRTLGNSMSAAKWEQIQMAACSFITAVGAKLGCPQSTIGTAQLLYQRFHLFYRPADFVMHEVALTCLFTSTKLNDTQKRLHEVLLASYAFRYPDLLGRPPATKDGTNGRQADWIAHTHVSENDMDAHVLHREQVCLLTLERMLLQCMCYNFQLRSSRLLKWTAKLARLWDMPKQHADLSWRIACDSHRTNAPWLYTPLTVAIGSVYACVALMHAAGHSIPTAQQFEHESSRWELRWSTCMENVDDVAIRLLQLYAQHALTLMSERKSERLVPPHVAYPPPMGLLRWRIFAPQDLSSCVTQALIYVRQRAQTRAQWPIDDRSDLLGQRKRFATEARHDDTLASTIFTPTPDDATRIVATRYLLPI